MMSTNGTGPRHARLARGAVMAALATVFAAVSHLAAGGNDPTPLALVATTLIALPLTVMLAGRAYGIVRTSVGVSVTQALFHSIFVWMGSAPPAPGAPLPAHAEHLGLTVGTIPVFDPIAQASALMWAFHALAAMVTVLMLRRGEAALRSLQRTLARVLFPRVLEVHPVAADARALALFSAHGTRTTARFFSVSAITHRGPPSGRAI